MTPAFHKRGGNACGGVAFSVKVRHPFREARAFPADNVVRLDGTEPLRGTVPICGSCGCVIDSFAELSYNTPLDKAADLARAFIRHVKAG